MELVKALDHQHKNKSLGENGHAQHTWGSKGIEELIVKFYFQLVRTSDENKLNEISEMYGNLINISFVSRNATYYMNILMRILFNTRDMINGKGEYTLFYHLLYQWNTLYKCNTHVKNVIEKGLRLNFLGSQNVHPYGSWKDVKYILEHYRQKKHNLNAGIPYFVTMLAVEQLKDDYKLFMDMSTDSTKKKDISLLSKWLPREQSSKFGYLAKHFAKYFYNNGVAFTNTQQQYHFLKKYRTMIATLNREIHTVQILQCAGRWCEIDFEKHVTSITMNRQRYAFSNKGKNKKRRFDVDRIECGYNYQQYLEDCKSGKSKVKAKRITLGAMVKEAFKHLHTNNPNNQDMVDALNLEWKAQNSHKYSIKNGIVMLDTSASMSWENCPLYDAIGLAIRIAENSSLGKRIMTFSSSPKWINLEGKNTLTEIVEEINQYDSGMNTNMFAALTMIASACVDKDLHPDVVNNLVFYILSDMQIDSVDDTWKTLHERINELFKESGLRTTHNLPYKAPTIVYWNMRSTNGFPCATNDKNIAMVSGYNISAIHSIIEKGTDALHEMTPWTSMIESLQKYELIEN